MTENFKTIEWSNNELLLIDQRKLPQEESYVRCRNTQEVGTAIRDMVVRGAPAIGVTAAFGVALAALASTQNNFNLFYEELQEACDELFATRPTAVNLRWALERMKHVCLENRELAIDDLKNRLRHEALTILEEDIATNRLIGEHGAKLIEDGSRVLTHCNAGALATGGHGTALGVLYSAKEQGKSFSVFADETRPFLQGARLTAWELAKNGIDVTLITDNMAAYFMQQKQIDSVIVGSDRIAANGDVANKIGTYNVAVLAKAHGIPFYVAAPVSTIDPEARSGEDIPIEERPIDEVTNFYRQAVAPQGIQVRNPAFDVTPHELVSAIVTEKGVMKKSYDEAIRELFKQ